jgi:hypothetical protein
MAESPERATMAGSAWRGSDRRRVDRRGKDRRTPLPLWRRPWALVLYGVLGTLLMAFALRISGVGSEPPADMRAVKPAAPSRTVMPAQAAAAPVEDARTAADYERLLAEGNAAVGRRVHVELFCGALNPVALRPGEPVYASVAAVADSSGQVPAAECRWGRGRGVRREEMLLVVPPSLAEAFAQAPLVSESFVPRRHIRAEIVWVGRSSALALRSVGVLQKLER